MKKAFVLFLLLVFSASIAFASTGSGRKVVASAGTAEALSATSTAITEITICAETNNTGVIAAGSDPIAAVNTREGIPLNAGDCWSPAVEKQGSNLTAIEIDATVSTEGVTYDWTFN